MVLGEVSEVLGDGKTFSINREAGGPHHGKSRGQEANRP